MKLKNSVSIRKKVMFLISSNDGSMVKYIPNTKNTLPQDRYSECSHCGQAVLSSCNVLGMSTMNNIIATPTNWNPCTIYLFSNIFSLNVISRCSGNF